MPSLPVLQSDAIATRGREGQGVSFFCARALLGHTRSRLRTEVAGLLPHSRCSSIPHCMVRSESSPTTTSPTHTDANIIGSMLCP